MWMRLDLRLALSCVRSPASRGGRHCPAYYRRAMSFKCQRDSYLSRYNSRVVSCCPAVEEGGRQIYEVVLEDTVLFPGGGGQPDDRGKINGIDVQRVQRRGATAVHFLLEPLQEGAEVEIEVDWKRRFDHMQQHSAQHLITAVADRNFGYKTASWYLTIGETQKCFVELVTPTVSPSQLREIEEDCNKAIRDHIPVTPRWYQSGTPELEKVRSRGLPDDFEGSEVRVVDIEGLDANMCCGTHVSNLSHLQCVKLLHTGPKKGSTLVYYIAGGRVVQYMERAYSNERALSKLLGVAMDEHKEAVEKLQQANKMAGKASRNQLRDIAQLLAQVHLTSPSPDHVMCIHRDDGDTEFMNTLANEVAPKGITVLVTVGGKKGAGQFLLAGKDEDVSAVGPKVAVILDGKGGGRKGRYQGKVSCIENRHQAEEALRLHLASQSTSQASVPS